MSRSTIYILIALAAFSLTGIIVTQIYWVNKAYDVQEKETNDRIVIAMSSVVQRIMEINADSSVVEPVKQVTSNFYVANINDTLHPYLLETLLTEEFTSSNLRNDFEYGVYDCFNDSIVFGGRVSFRDGGASSPAQEIKFQKRFDKDGHYFGIYYPSKQQMIFGQMDFWLFSSAMLIIVIFIFVYAIFIILRQKRLSEVKTDFINNMTHELKTPISTISISSQVLMQNNIHEDPERLHRYAEIVSNENNRLKLQVDKVLQIATLNPQSLELQYEKIDMHQLIENAVTSNQLIAQETEGKIDMNLSATSFSVNGDRVHLTNILYNLMDNAIKYCEGAPKIEVSSRNDGKWFIFEIKDNGIGIPSKYQSQVFDQFFRVPKGNQHDVKGFGLGLYYVKTIVESHKGKINLKSTIDKGSSFTIQLPTS